MQVTPALLTLIMLIVAFVGAIWIPLSWLLLSAITPKQLLARYFKQPHFSLTETYMMREFPGSLMRTSIFAWLVVFPGLDRKRNIKDVKRHCPPWYAFCLRYFLYSVLLFGGLFWGLMGVLFLVYDAGPDYVLFTLWLPF